MATLDHLVVLVPADGLRHPPAWLTAAFTLLDGGQHSNGVTANQLVLLADGVYLELIAFVGDDPAGRAAHRWGAEPESHIIDWALSLPGLQQDTDPRFRALQAEVAAADVGLGYSDLVPGGRTTPDGAVLRWATSAPTPAVLGALPFWCLDRTPRQLRVPFHSGQLAHHPSGARGVAAVTVHAPDEALLARLARVYEAILGSPQQPLQWELAVPEPIKDRPALLRLALDPSGTERKIVLSLWTTGEPKTVRGDLGGCRLEIRLESVGE